MGYLLLFWREVCGSCSRATKEYIYIIGIKKKLKKSCADACSLKNFTYLCNENKVVIITIL